MWISYSSSEVKVYHPICEAALNAALKKLKLDKKYRVLHHKMIGNLEMDFAIQNTNTGKYLCVVEVKRTPSDVHSARYQCQAQTYVSELGTQREKPYYVLTNLEYSFIFKYDLDRPRVCQQMLMPGLIHCGNFSDTTKSEFESRLVDTYSDIIKLFTSDATEYLVTLDNFTRQMEIVKNNPKAWKSSLAILLYEYIRGSFAAIARTDLKYDVKSFHNNIQRICNEAVRVNFKEIFEYNSEKFEQRNDSISNSELSDIFTFGNQNISGDSLADVLHQIVSEGKEHDGEVATDLELGRAVAVLTKDISGEIPPNKKILDPAAGSGSLISSAISSYNLSPNQIKVNDINPQLLELLSLRLGLTFPSKINRTNSPLISSSDLVNLNPSYFDDVDVVLVNPPFVAGINCVSQKPKIYARINELSGGVSAITKIGQIGLEIPFLECLIKYCKSGTTVACILPKTYLTARGDEAKITRHLLLRNLNVQTIFLYPGDNLFNCVTKDTCVVIGKINEPNDKIKIISSIDNVHDINLDTLSTSLSKSDLTDDFTSLMPGVEARIICRKDLEKSINDGWRVVNSEMADAIEFVKSNFADNDKLTLLGNYGDEIAVKRGTAGNSGASDLLFISSTPELYEKNSDVLTKPGMRNAKYDSFILNRGDSEFLDESIIAPTIINKIVSDYLKLPRKDGKQQRKTKSQTELLEILRKESKNSFPENSVLVPRSIRRQGKAYFANQEMFVSTNFLVYTPKSYRKTLVLSTWMNTIFYQLNCEVSAKDQEGMRKMEKEDLENTYVPLFDKITDEDVSKLSSLINDIEFIDLMSPSANRMVDKIWSNIIFENNADEKLSDARRLLEFLANKRNHS